MQWHSIIKIENMNWKNWQTKNKFSLFFCLVLFLIGLSLFFTEDATGRPGIMSFGISFLMGFGIIMAIIHGSISLLQGTDLTADKLLIYIWILSLLIIIPINFYIGRFIYWIYGKIKKKNKYY